LTDDEDCQLIGLGIAPEESMGDTVAPLCGIDWAEEGFVAGATRSWCVVEAEADMDLDGNPVFVRGNSYNNRTYRDPNPDDGATADVTY